MRIVNLEGRLETQGSWEEVEDNLKRQQEDILKLRVSIRRFLEGTPFESEYKSPETSVPKVQGPQKRPKSKGRREFIVPNQVDKDDHRPITSEPWKSQVWYIDKPPVIWLRYTQISRLQRIRSIWHHLFDDGTISPASVALLYSNKGVKYLKAHADAKLGDEYDPSKYRHPDADGWFEHGPQFGLRPLYGHLTCLVLYRSGVLRRKIACKVDWSWRKEPHLNDVVAWKLA